MKCNHPTLIMKINEITYINSCLLHMYFKFAETWLKMEEFEWVLSGNGLDKCHHPKLIMIMTRITYINTFLLHVYSNCTKMCLKDEGIQASAWRFKQGPTDRS
jgi:hypothetical protein